MTLNGNTLHGIANGGTLLTAGIDYTVSGNTVTLKKEYLAGLPVGNVSLTFVFSEGKAQTFTITIYTIRQYGTASFFRPCSISIKATKPRRDETTNDLHATEMS